MSWATVYKILATQARIAMAVQGIVPADDEGLEANVHPHANLPCASCREITDADGPQVEKSGDCVRATINREIDRVQILI